LYTCAQKDLGNVVYNDSKEREREIITVNGMTKNGTLKEKYNVEQITKLEI
jgi:hypothetical protein